MGPGDAGQIGGSASGSLRTRSHSRADPVWTVQDMLVLVNEIAFVEAECQNALSTYQKWSMIAENCTALEVVRNSNQCRRKWQSLLAEYNLIKQWEANSGEDSYWSLGFDKRKEAGLPVDLDKELYEAIDNFTKLEDQADTDPEDDPEAAEIDVLDDDEPGPKRKKVRRRSNLPKKITGQRKQHVFKEELAKPVPFIEEMEQIPTDCKPKRLRYRSTPQKGNSEEKKQLTPEEELEESVPVVEEMEQIPTDCEHKRLRHRLTPYKASSEGKKQLTREEELEESAPVEEMVQILTDCEPKRLRHCSIPQKGNSEGKKQLTPEEELEESVPVEAMEQIVRDSKPRRSRHWSTPQKGNLEEKEQPMPQEHLKEPMPVVQEMEQVLEDSKLKRARRQSTPKKVLSKRKKQSGLDEELGKPDPQVEQMQQILAEKLKENTELIHAILAGNLSETVDDKLVDLIEEDTLKTERVRCKADKLIACLIDLTKNLEQLCDVVEGC